ncbi:MAG: AAA family ATPase [Saprospiraceae bacterium]|nr:AAA family ATPase [Saprospiraceae bacterium]
MQILELSDDFKYALDLIEKTTTSVFITGRAGTGKSTLLQLFKNTTRKKNVVLAPTGVAALNVGGQTIHSFFGFPPKLITTKDIRKHRNRKLFQQIELLIIDEISMVRADMLDNIDYFLRLNRESPHPFGGVQVVFFGDLFQLPPVVSNDFEKEFFDSYYKSPYFFSAKVFMEFQMAMLELKKVYRQEARYFIRLLDAVRTNKIDYDDLEDLNERYIPDFNVQEFYITLSARNTTVDKINTQALQAIPLPEQIYYAQVKGDFNPKLFPTELGLRLKLNAQVMFLRNDPDKQFVNGTLGKIVKLEAEHITVMVEEQGKEQRYIKVQPIDWEIIRYKQSDNDIHKIETEVIGTFTQYPLKLAWAITIHKAQGKTFDKVIIDLDKGAFEFGQTYVALSRCRSLEGIVLTQPLKPSDIITDPRVVEFYEQNF